MENGKPEKAPDKKRIIDSFWTFLVATACFGPLALPLLWRNPKYSKTTKMAGSIAVLVFTYFLLKFMKDSTNELLKLIDELQLSNLE